MKTLENYKANFLKSAKEGDFRFHCSYGRIEDCTEVARFHGAVDLKDKVQVIQIAGLDGLTICKNGKIVVDYKIVQNGSRFDLFELTLNAYNRYENNLD